MATVGHVPLGTMTTREFDATPLLYVSSIVCIFALIVGTGL